jgi:Transposase DDE domain
LFAQFSHIRSSAVIGLMDVPKGDLVNEGSTLFARFAKRAPLSVMTRIVLENLVGAAQLDAVFRDVAQRQYANQLLFSTCAELLVEVTLFGCSSVNAAYLRNQEDIPVSVVSVYEKLQRVEPAVCEALVARTADRAQGVITKLEAERPEPIAGYRLRIGDGNVLGRSERRLSVLRGTNVAALPGQSVVLFDYATGLISRTLPCEDAHVSEKRLMLGLLPHLEPGDLFMGDSAYGTQEFMQGIRDKKASFLVRHHSSLKLHPAPKGKGTAPRKRTGTCRTGTCRTGTCRTGTCRTGTIYEQSVTTADGQKFRAITLERSRSQKPLRNGKRTLTLLTNVPRKKASAKKLLALYLKRWKIEEAFRQLTQDLSCEVNTLGYPKAALLAFSLAVLAFNCLACVKAALASRHGWDKVDAELSSYHMASEVKRTFEGMCIALSEETWEPFAAMDASSLAAALKDMAATLSWARYRKARRGPKKSVRKSCKRHQHVATAKLLTKADDEKHRPK